MECTNADENSETLKFSRRKRKYFRCVNTWKINPGYTLYYVFCNTSLEGNY